MTEVSVLLQKPGKLLLESRDAAAAVENLLGAAGPGRVRLGVDVEVQLVAFLAPGGARLVFGSIGHHDRNGMIIRMNLVLHGSSFGAAGACIRVGNLGFGALYNGNRPSKQAPGGICQWALRGLSDPFAAGLIT